MICKSHCVKQLIAAVSLEYNSENDTEIMENFVMTWNPCQGIMVKRAKASTELDPIYLPVFSFYITADFRDTKSI